MKLYPFLLLSAFAAVAPASATILAPTPYLCFDRAAISGCGTSDSPFAGQSFSYFHLETFEDNLLNTPGVSQTGGVIGGFGSITDSVDADDGTINGVGNTGRSMFSNSTIRFTFSATTLGDLPTHVGVVFTDTTGAGSNVTFSAFDLNGGLLGTTTAFLGADGSNSGTTAEDRFFGWSGSDGVGSISISASTLEIDHLQYGFAAASNPIPEPSTWAMMIAGFGLLGAASRRRRDLGPNPSSRWMTTGHAKN